MPRIGFAVSVYGGLYFGKIEQLTVNHEVAGADWTEALIAVGSDVQV